MRGICVFARFPLAHTPILPGELEASARAYSTFVPWVRGRIKPLNFRADSEFTP